MFFINEFQGGSVAFKSKKDLRLLTFVIIFRVGFKCIQFDH